MLGRGTRLGERYPDKARFVVFDCFDGTLLEYFRNTTGMTVEQADGDGKMTKQIIEEIWQNLDREYNVRRLVKRLQRVDKQMSGEARDLFARFILDGDVARFAEELPGNIRSSFSETMKALRDEDFQKLLTEYPKARQRFVEATTVIDTVSSEWLIKAGVGKEYKPADYLQLFAQFVTEHAEDVRAISILLSRPQDWNADVLRELRAALREAPEQFTDTNLQQAFQASRHKALVDIISMVKNAAIAATPLLTAEERVNAAVEQISITRVLTDDQSRWLEYIRQHLVQNLSIEREDFEVVPVLSDHGGWRRANRTFDGQLTHLLESLNRELVVA
jgi:type I restriction enzyme R subunit